MAFTAAQFSLSNTPTLLATGAGDTRVLIRLPGSNIVIGPDNTVSSGSGFPVATLLDFQIRDGQEIWAVAQAGTVDAFVLTTN